MNKIVTTSFHGTELYAFHLGSIVYVALKPIVRGMGLDWSAQFRRVQRDPILSEGVAMMAMPFGPGGPQQSVCLRLDLVHGWLFTIDSTRVRDDLRERVQLYQRECYDVLFRHFSGEAERLLHQQQESESLRIRMVAECRQTFGDRAAQELWKEIGLPEVAAMNQVLRQGDLFGWRHDRAA